jgi:hypothetical protein
VNFGDYRFEVMDIDNYKIDQILVTRQEKKLEETLEGKLDGKLEEKLEGNLEETTEEQ